MSTNHINARLTEYAFSPREYGNVIPDARMVT